MRNKIALFFLVLFALLPAVALAQQGGAVPPITAPGVDPIPDLDNATETILTVIEILLIIVGLVAVLFVIVGGFRYITAHGNEEASESAKKTITNAIIGIVIVLLAFVIVRVIANALIYTNV